jgi:hypothetical protein
MDFLGWLRNFIGDPLGAEVVKDEIAKRGPGFLEYLMSTESPASTMMPVGPPRTVGEEIAPVMAAAEYVHEQGIKPWAARLAAPATGAGIGGMFQPALPESDVMRKYEAWDDPMFKLGPLGIGVKGFLETLPYMIPIGGTGAKAVRTATKPIRAITKAKPPVIPLRGKSAISEATALESAAARGEPPVMGAEGFVRDMQFNEGMVAHAIQTKKPIPYVDSQGVLKNAIPIRQGVKSGIYTNGIEVRVGADRFIIEAEELIAPVERQFHQRLQMALSEMRMATHSGDASMINTSRQNLDTVIANARRHGYELAPDELATISTTTPEVSVRAGLGGTETAAIQGEDAAAKLLRLIKQGKPERKLTEAERHGVMAQKVAVFHSMKNRGLAAGKPTIEAYRGAKGALKGEMPEALMPEFPAMMGFTEAEAASLFDRIATSPKFISPTGTDLILSRNTAMEALSSLILKGKIPTWAEIGLLETEFGKEFVQAILRKRRLGLRAFETFLDAINLPRALMASWDFSAPLRQGLILTVARPKESLPIFPDMYRAFMGEKFAEIAETAWLRRANAQLYLDRKLFVAPLTREAPLMAREEAFISTLFNTKVGKWVFPLVRASERAFVVFLNRLRMDVFDSIVAKWERQGLTRLLESGKPNPDFINRTSSLAQYINHATGRGDLPAFLKGAAPILNVAFWSPRLQAARIGLPFVIARAEPAVRKEALRDIAITFTAGTTGLGLAAAAGLKMEIDPRSSDFGKVRIGNTRIDFWGGFQQYARVCALLINNWGKSASKGTVYPLQEYGGRASTIGHFVRGKTNPAIGFIIDLLSGETFIGEELEATAGQAITFPTGFAGCLAGRGLDGRHFSITRDIWGWCGNVPR